MSWSSNGQLISDSKNSAVATWTTTATLSRALNVGEIGIIAVAVDNSESTAGTESDQVYLSDSVGNTWYRIKEYQNPQGAQNNGATISLWWTLCTVQLTTSGTFTATTTSGTRTAWAITGWSFSSSLSSPWVRCVAAGVKSDAAADAGSITISGLTSQEYLFVRAIGREANSTAFTPTANYTSIGTAASAGAMSVCGEFRITSGTGDTSDPTTSSADQASVYVALQEVDATTIVHAASRLTTGSSTSNATSYATASITPTAGRLVVLVVLSTVASGTSPSTPTTPTQTNGLTWTLQKATQIPSNSLKLSVFTGTSTSITGAEAVTIDFAGQTQTNCVWLICELTNVSGTVVQAVSGTSTSGTRATATLASFANSANAAFVAAISLATGGSVGMGPEAGYDYIASRTIFESNGYSVGAFIRPDNGDLSVTFLGNTSGSGSVVVGLEIAYQSPTVTVTASGLSSSEGVGTGVVTLRFGVTGVASSAAIGTGAIQSSAPSVGIASAEALGTAAITVVAAVAGVASAEALGTAAITIVVAVAGVASAEALGTAVATVASRVEQAAAYGWLIFVDVTHE